MPSTDEPSNSKRTSDAIVFTRSHSNLESNWSERRHPVPLWQSAHFSHSYRAAVREAEACNYYAKSGNMDDYVDTSSPRDLLAERRKRLLKRIICSELSQHQKVKCVVIGTITFLSFMSITSLFLYLYGSGGSKISPHLTRCVLLFSIFIDF